jgi:sugar (pentulose or hexulose) kinase
MYLSIDLGSTHFKAGLFDDDLIQQGISRYSLTYVQTNGIEVELSIDEVEKGIRYIIREALSQSNVKEDEIKAIGITSQAQTFTILDERGNPKTNFISWQDKRAVKTSQKMRESAEWSDFAEHSSFGLLYPGLQVCLLKHIQEHNPGFIAENDMILKLPSYVVKQLADESYLDNNLAEMSGLFSLQHNNWWEKALDICGLRSDQLPEIREVGTIACMTTKNARNYGLIEGIPVILAGNDQTAGAYGAKIHENGSVLITLGTAQVIYQCLSEMPKASAKIVRGSYPYGLFYRLAVDNAGGSAINWAKNEISEIGSYEKFFTLVESAQTDRKGLIFQYDEDMNKGSWNIKDDKYKPADFARSVLEYLCDRMVKMMKEIDLNPVKMNIVCAGGGSTQKVWVDMLSKYLGTNITSIQAESLLGVAMMMKQK